MDPRHGERPAVDFTADIDALMDAAQRGEGPKTMADIASTARRFAGEVDCDPAVRDWLRDNAMPLIGQQLLVASVTAVQDPEREFEVALRASREALGDSADAQSVLAWLMENRPGELRAWLVRVQLPVLIAGRLDEPASH